MPERVRYTRPREKSEQYQYDDKDAVRSQEEARAAQEKARKAGEAICSLSDDVLADIDIALDGVTGEETVLEFINGLEQKGGQ